MSKKIVNESVVVVDMDQVKKFAQENGYEIEDSGDGWYQIVCPESNERVASFNDEGDIAVHDDQFMDLIDSDFDPEDMYGELDESVEVDEKNAKYLITYKNGKTEEKILSRQQRAAMRLSKDWDKIKSIMGLGYVDEDGAPAGPSNSGAPAPGAATLDGTVGRASFDFGNNPQNGNSDQKVGSGEPMGGGIGRELTQAEIDLLETPKKLNEGVKITRYQDFRKKVISKDYIAKKAITESINKHLGDFGADAHNAIKSLPIVDGMFEIKSINKALSGIYNTNQVRKVLNEVLDRKNGQ